MNHPDFFEVLELPVTPVPDAEVLKSNYLRLSASVHPDRPENASRSESETNKTASNLNEAYQVLKHVPSRLRYLIQLLSGQAPGNLKQVPEAVGDQFMEVGALIHDLDALLKEKPGEGSTELAQVLFLKNSMQVKSKVESMMNVLDQDLDRLEERLASVAQKWDLHVASNNRLLLQELLPVYHEWTFIDRWRGQLSNRLLECVI